MINAILANILFIKIDTPYIDLFMSCKQSITIVYNFKKLRIDVDGLSISLFILYNVHWMNIKNTKYS